MRSLSCAQVRDVDRRALEEYGLPTLVLMENAGRSASHLLDSLQVAGPVAIVCGKGNNGGDGLVMARHLQSRGHDVRVLLASPPSAFQGDAALFLQVVQRAEIPCVDLSEQPADVWRQQLNHAAWIVDALLGTGLKGPVRGTFAEIIATINRSSAKVLAIDLPSGFDADAGRPEGLCIRATVTGTFVARKIGFDQSGAEFWTGRVHVLDIGLPWALLRSLESQLGSGGAA